MNTLWEEKAQREDAVTARAKLEEWANTMQHVHEAIQAIVASGHFDTVPTDIKAALNDGWTILKTSRSAVAANAALMELLAWRP